MVDFGAHVKYLSPESARVSIPLQLLMSAPNQTSLIFLKDFTLFLVSLVGSYWPPGYYWLSWSAWCQGGCQFAPTPALTVIAKPFTVTSLTAVAVSLKMLVYVYLKCEILWSLITEHEPCKTRKKQSDHA